MRNRFSRISAIVVAGCTVVGVAPAAAQEAFPTRVTLHLNGAFQAAPSAFETLSSQRAYGEEATFRTVHSLDGAPAVDAGLMFHFRERFAVGAAVTRMQVADAATFTGAVPHPLVAGSPRMAAPQELGLQRKELAVHLSAAFRIPLNTRMELTLSAGPTAFNVTQDTVVGLVFQEGAPPDFDQIGLAAETGRQRRNAIGGHVGIDLAFMATRRIGFGYFVRFARATVDLPGRDETTIAAKAGSVQTGGGVRVRF